MTVTSGDCFTELSGNGVSVVYVDDGGGMYGDGLMTLDAMRNASNLVGSDGKQWSNGEEMLHAYLCAAHLFNFEFHSPPPADLGGASSGVQYARMPIGGTPV